MSNIKDPAFLFYSKDFYEGTRTMLPEERACYIDLMIYQHQNGSIPANDLKRVLMYCNGIDKATLEATLEAKFKLKDGVYLNNKLSDVIEERKQFSDKQSTNGSVGQFWKKSKALLDAKSYSLLKSLLYKKTNLEIFDLIKEKNIDKAMLEAMLKHLANEDAIEDISIIKEDSIVENSIFQPNQFLIPIDKLLEHMLSDDQWVQDIARIHHLSTDYDKAIECSKQWISLYVDKLRGDNVKEKPIKDCFGHCSNWIKQEKNRQQNGRKEEKPVYD